MKRLASIILIGFYLTLAAGSNFGCGESPIESMGQILAIGSW